MKKILVATLALSLAVVSMVDAIKVSGAAAGAKAADVLGAAKDLVDAKKEKMPVQEPAKDVVAELTNPNMTQKQRELVAKRAQRAELEKLARLKKDEISDIGYGFFGFGTSEEQKSQHRKAKADLSKINADLKEVNARLRELETITGRRWSKAVEYGLGALAAVGIVVVAYGVDRYGFEGAGMKFASEQAAAGYEWGKGKAAGAYGYAGEKYQAGKRRVRGMLGYADEAAATAAEAVVAPVEAVVGQ